MKLLTSDSTKKGRQKWVIGERDQTATVHSGRVAEGLHRELAGVGALITVDLAGVGFWNPSRSTRGALANGAELRPVTNFKIVNGCGIG